MSTTQRNCTEKEVSTRYVCDHLCCRLCIIFCQKLVKFNNAKSSLLDLVSEEGLKREANEFDIENILFLDLSERGKSVYTIMSIR